MPQDIKTKVVELSTQGQTRRPLTLPRITVTGRQMRQITRDALKALEAANRSNPVLFIRSGQISRLIEDEKHRPMVQALTEPALRGKLARVATFQKENNKAISDALPPAHT